MLTALFSIRFVSVLAVIAALFGALLMFLTGSSETIEAYQLFLGFKEPHLVGGPNLESYVKLLSALDQFLFGLVLLYFAYSIYFLFLRREIESDSETHIRMPDWLKVKSMGEMKKTLLEVIVVLLAVLFLKIGLESQTELSLALLIIPIGIVAIGATIKLIDFDR